MNKFRPYIVAATVILAALLAYGFLTLPKARPADYDGFSATDVLEDIEVISKEHHSVGHPEERAVVRDYLVGRLEGLGGDVTLFQYDSLSSPENRHVRFVFDAVNVLAEFPPLAPSADTTYLMFVAHYDSRHSTIMPRKDTVWSYGAADDGYGLGVILETVDELLKIRQDWKQGVKVLFTDGEEVGMMGMKCLWEHDRQVFDNVGFMINVEARGTDGPALLFETSPGNEKVMDLYASAARYPYTYSLTTLVYRFMPNFTDFKIVKDEVPGMNFSTIDDVNTYHTDEDNFSNVSAASIQHYGEQILPIAEAYLTDTAYSDVNMLKAENDTANFTIPALGLFNFSKGVYKVLNVAVFLIFLMLFSIEGLRGRVKAMDVFRNSCIVLCVGIGVLALGELIAYLGCLVAGARFKPFGVVQGVRFDNVLMVISIVLIAAAAVMVYVNARGNAMRHASSSLRASASSNAVTRHAYNVLYGSLTLMLVLSMILLFALGENLMFFIPFAFATFALVLVRLTSFKLWLPLAVALILLHAFSFLYALAVALTIGAFGVVAMLAFLDLMVIIPMIDLYIIPTK